MFIETITAPRHEWEHWKERIGMLSDPPKALVALISWEADGQVTQATVWDHPSAVANFYLERVLPVIEQEGEPASKPRRHGEPLAFYVRPSP